MNNWIATTLLSLSLMVPQNSTASDQVVESKEYHTIIKLTDCNPCFIGNPEHIQNYIKSFYLMARMINDRKITIVDFGDQAKCEEEEGIHVIQFGDNYSIYAHFSPKFGTARIDILSYDFFCGPTIAVFAAMFFNGTLEDIDLESRKVSSLSNYREDIPLFEDQ